MIVKRQNRNKHRFSTAGMMLAVGILLASCAPRVDVRGNLPDPDLLADIEVGKVRKNDVASLLGSPSSVATFGTENWYYISERLETTAFFAPVVLDRKIVIIRFDDKGLVSDIVSLGLEDGRNIDVVDRKTPTAGNEITFLQQLLGNLGRFEGSEDGLKAPGQR